MIVAAFLMIAGAVCVAVFVYLNLNVPPRLFAGHRGNKSASASAAGAPSESHLLFGLMLIALFSVGMALVSMGSAIIATTLGYGHS